MSSPVADYCWTTMRALAEDFRKGKGSGEIFECCYLTYLEVAEVASGRDPARVWDGWAAVAKEQGTDKPLNRTFGDTGEGREKLVKTLEEFTATSILPRRNTFSVPPSCVDAVEDKPAEPQGAIELLFGDQT